MFILTVLIIGLSGITAQVLLLRELLVAFYGNELTLGVILANWLITEAMGVLIIGKFIDRVKEKINIFAILQILFLLSLPVALYLSRTFKVFLGIPFGEAVGLWMIFFASFFILLPVSFCHGGLFACACRIHSSLTRKPRSSIGKIYGWETIGTLAGGIAVTYLFIPFLDSFQIAFVVCLANLAVCLFFLKQINRFLKYALFFLILLFGYLALNQGFDGWQLSSLNRQWQSRSLLACRNSIYGNLAVTTDAGQYTFFYNGIPAITAPYPDVAFAQEFGNLPLLFHPHPESLLITSGGAGGLINEAIKHPLKKIDYLELDPLIFAMLKQFPTDLTQKELSDPRVKVINSDSRYFLKTTNSQYDIILVGLSKPQDLIANRAFTQEFFLLARARLRPAGILSFCLPGSLTYLSHEVKDLNATILNALKSAYKYVRIIPGDYNLYLASDAQGILQVNPGLITERISQRKIKAGLLVGGYLEYRLGGKWRDWFNQSLADATKKVNRDLEPFALFQMLLIWNKQFSGSLTPVFASLGNLDLKSILISILTLSCILFFVFRLYHFPLKPRAAYSIFTTGFFGMLVSLILIFAFQIFYGYLYYKVGLLISVFMAGIGAGSLFMTGLKEKIKYPLQAFIKIEALIVLFSFALAWLITGLSNYLSGSLWVFLVLFFVSGGLVGLEFPLAANLYSQEKEKIGRTSGILYFADLLGGWLAGILGGVVFLPVLGLFGTCALMALFKLSSLFLWLTAPKNPLTHSAI